MSAHHIHKAVTEVWEYSSADIERLILEDLFGPDYKLEVDTVSIRFEMGQNFNGAVVTHKYTEEA